LNPAAIQREIQELTERPLTITTGKKGPAHEPSTTAPLRAHLDMSTGARAGGATVAAAAGPRHDGKSKAHSDSDVQQPR
jgi:hypothetical protein